MSLQHTPDRGAEPETIGRETDSENVCRFFERADHSLIEEPEICENCRYITGTLCTLPQSSV